jgi:integrase
MSDARRFRDLTEEFLAWQAIRCESLDTVRYNLAILQRHLGDLLITEIGAPQIEAMIAARLKDGLARATINRQRATLSRFYTWAISRGHHPGPSPLASVKAFRESPGRTRFLSPDEAARLTLAAAPHLKPIILMSLRTGGRRGEVLALRRGDVDLERRIVTFRRETTKSRRGRVLPMTPDLAAALRTLLQAPGCPEDRLFQWGGRPIRSVRTAFQTAARKAGIGRDVTWHSLRHTMASWAAMNGIRPQLLQQYLGHSTMKMAERYTHLSPEFVMDGVSFLRTPGPARKAQDDES